ncbi:MAG: DMT family transporter [Proteobacteria bacterium]|nr:DMT family transporter [Pseudomonadota bacterium]
MFSTFLFIASLRVLPLAETISITFAGPLFITALAARTLGEQVGWRRWAAVVVGFLGVLLMFRPGDAAFNWGAALALVAALSGAIRDLITRRITQTESSLSILMVTTATVALGGLATWPFGWSPPPPGHAALLMLGGGLLGAAHFLMIEAFRWAEATLVAPFKYFTVLWAVIAGVLVWDHWPDAWMGAGMVLVVGSGLYIFHSETRAPATSALTSAAAVPAWPADRRPD